ncbi:MAG: hypothetical protein CBB67_013855 [Alteromonadaceae bacterium TMED7]|nr:hypothetical protein [Alteromonadaceae bacterium]RPH16976.1 MAG: hypothetical protein CBB67_013855 [Alteromonadaceae bacterium TMED7]|tara:strand:- start:24301 stop:25095 length:795 start_codon:yes stop_codon:yes gene_type:complete
MQAKPIIILAAQRTGTTSLNKALDSSGRFTTFYEVFLDSEAHQNHPANYFYWLKNVCTLVSNHNADAVQLLPEYLRYLASLAKSEVFFLDIKYSQFRHFAERFDVALEQLGVCLQALQIPVIHLYRQNAFARYLSNLLMLKVKKHYYQAGDKVEYQSGLTVPPEKAAQNLREYALQVSCINDFFAAYPLFIPQVYEDLFEGVNITASFLESLSGVSGQAIPPLQTEYIKTPVDYAQLIANKDELLGYFEASEYRHQVYEIVGHC